ncbi:hypothetical protein C435_02502 [Haloarcula marismortui ATCC 33799]|uniref:Ribbon-helix-helix protein CopG domain-containing protein n=1 Tax=Haloarcula marismortui ATCC 33799 TaxID=662475 RepID=M0KVU2_9EURY|nr:hypothetical protein C435_02502 [Haloarcula californiae ATCC 33799]
MYSNRTQWNTVVSQGDKQQVAVRVPLRQKAELEREAAERGISRSEYIRTILTDRHRVDELEERLSIREDRIDELQTQLAERSQIQEQIEDLPDKIRGEMTYQERRQRMLDQASLTQRLRWKVTGVPVDETTDH